MSASPSPRCRVVDGGKLPADSGGPAALCEAIEHALSAAAPGADFSVEVRVRPNSMLSASVMVNGRALPDQKFASMDRDLDRNAFAQFARSIADRVCQVSGR